MRLGRVVHAIGPAAGALALVAALFLSTSPVAAAGTVTACGNDSQFSTRLASGGTVTFNCGRKTILLASAKSVTKNTVIDGGGRITLSGASLHQLFHVAGSATLTLKNIVLKNGKSTGDGGAITNAGTLHLDHVRITGSNTAASGSGGAIYSTGTVTAKHSTFDHDTAGNAGAIMAFDGASGLTVTDSSLHDNRALGSGGLGGAIVTWDGATARITGSDFAANTATGYGGAIENSFSNSSITVSRSHLDGNLADLGGAGIYSGGTLTISASTLDRNFTVDGGGIWSIGVLVATNDTFWDNSAANTGGGLEISGSAYLYNVTVAENGAGAPNVPGSGGGIYQASGVLWLFNSLIANTIESDNCTFHGSATGISSLSTDGTCNFGSGHDNVTVKLGALDTNGGPVPTMRLPKGSLAIDGGTSGSCAATDARGVTRIKGSACDVGAYEYRPCLGKPTAPATPAVDSGAASITARPVFLDWVGADCTRTYSVVVRYGSATGPKVFSTANLTDSSATTNLLGPGNTYYWRVTACNTHGCTVGPWWHFTPRGA